MAGEKFDPFLYNCNGATLVMVGALALRCASIVQTRSTSARPEECYEVQQEGNAVRMLINRCRSVVRHARAAAVNRVLWPHARPIQRRTS